VVTSAKSIAYNYLSGWFLVDLVAALPFDLLYVSNLSWWQLVSAWLHEY